LNILLIPGFMLDAELWRDVRPALSSMGQVIDADTTRDDTIADMAARAIAALDEPATVIGFSMGGYVAREMVYQAPQLVRALALVATSSRSDGHAAPARPDAPRFRQLGRGAVLRSLHPDHRSDAVVARVQEMSARLGAEVFSRQSRMVRNDDTEQLGLISCPTVVVAAADDELRTVAESQILHDGIAGSTMTIVERCGHLVPLEQPAALLEALSKLGLPAIGC